MQVRNTSEGKKVGLKKPVQNACVSSQAPGVSMKVRMPLMMNRLSQAKRKYRKLTMSRFLRDSASKR